MGSLSRRWVVLALTGPILAACTPVASARTGFRPRIGGAMGIIPAHGHAETASGTSIPVVYHGGRVMRGVTLHTVFWAPRGYGFTGSPATGVAAYEPLIQQFLGDAAHDSGATTSNVFSVLSEYPDGSGRGLYRLSYSSVANSIDDTSPYPAKQRQCVSPAGIATCVTDLQIQQELDRVISAQAPRSRGLHDVWFVLLPPDVDTCVSPGSCGTSAYAGYHGLSNLGHGPVIYSVIPDPLIEFTPPPGEDPQGNPEAESTLDTVAHEAVEAITNPEGVGWMDPNGFEVGDKCETGPQQGRPLGFAPNGSAYNQVINGHHYLIQMMWSNTTQGCEQASASTGSALPLPEVDLTQFSPTVTGYIGRAKAGVTAAVLLLRAGVPVAAAGGRTNRHGKWRAVLRSVSNNTPQAVGDDRDLIAIHYSRGGPAEDIIATGSGGNPFTESGWTGWFALDTGFAVGRRSVEVGPCSQTGVLAVRVNGRAAAPPIEQCETENDVATVSTGPLGPGTRLTLSSLDNRAVALPNPPGALVRLNVPLGEPESVAAFGNSQVQFPISGFPTCTADLRAQAVGCSGLVPGRSYSLTRSRGRLRRTGRADDSGTARFGGWRATSGPRRGATAAGIRGGDMLTLRNSSRRVLSTLHVARLRVDLTGNQTVIRGGRCQPGQYYGRPLTDAPLSPGIGIPGVTGAGLICPLSGKAAGLPAGLISQVDDRSGGQTRTEVPVFLGTAPAQDATLYGRFLALAQTAIPGPNNSRIRTHTHVSLTITRTGGRRAVFRAADVGTARGVWVAGLPRGSYQARWVLSDSGGDTRSLLTQFVEAG